MWLETTAQILREGHLSALDTANLLEEIEDLGRSEKRAVYSNLKILWMHLLKFKYTTREAIEQLGGDDRRASSTAQESV